MLTKRIINLSKSYPNITIEMGGNVGEATDFKQVAAAYEIEITARYLRISSEPLLSLNLGKKLETEEEFNNATDKCFLVGYTLEANTEKLEACKKVLADSLNEFTLEKDNNGFYNLVSILNS